MKELNDSNPKLKNGLAIFYYKLGGIYTDKQKSYQTLARTLRLKLIKAILNMLKGCLNKIVQDVKD
ncbi:MAG: hypothetical protein QM487_06170 [Candidatus Marithrix sp.]